MIPTPVVINGCSIGPGHRPYVVAEMSGNHNGDLERAFKIMEAAKKAGADAIKIQTYTPDTMTIDHDGPGFVIEDGLWKGRSLYDLYDEAHTPWDWQRAMFEKACDLEITLFSTPFDETSLAFLEDLGAPAYKIASFEAIDLPLIDCVAKTGKPVILSTGMADMAEISEAVETAQNAGCEQLILLHCVSGYPTNPEDANLKTLPHLADHFGVVGGLSDHTLGTAVSVAAVAIGAAFIEKHFTLARADGGPDAAFSMEPEEMKRLCDDCHTAWKAMGRISYERKPSEENNAVFRRSLYVVEDIAQGEVFEARHVRRIRPGFGLPPKALSQVIGARATCDIKRGTPLDWSLVSTNENGAK